MKGDTIILPKELVTIVRKLQAAVSQEMYKLICTVIFDLTRRDVLNDQFDVSEEGDGNVLFEWPRYGLYFELVAADSYAQHFYLHKLTTSSPSQVEFWLGTGGEDPRTKHDTRDRLVDALDRVVRKDDPYDHYRRPPLDGTEQVAVPF